MRTAESLWLLKQKLYSMCVVLLRIDVQTVQTADDVIQAELTHTRHPDFSPSVVGLSSGFLSSLENCKIIFFNAIKVQSVDRLRICMSIIIELKSRGLSLYNQFKVSDQ